MATKEINEEERNDARIRDEVRYIRKRELERDSRLDVKFH